MGLFQKKTPTSQPAPSSQPAPAPESASAPQPISNAGYCVVTKSLLNGTSRFKWIFREEDLPSSGWCALGDTDSQDYVNDADNLKLVEFRQLAEIEPAVWNIYHMPLGSDLEFCSDASGKYFVNTLTGEKIREAVKHPGQIAFEKNLKFLNQNSYPDRFFEQLFQPHGPLMSFQAGEVDFPSGTVVLADPLAYLGTRYQTTLERRIPAGRYPVTLSVLYSRIVGPRIAAAKLTISREPIACYELAMPQDHTLQDVDKPGVLSVFGVDTGLGCFADGECAVCFREFLARWHQENPEKNHYDDYFEQYFLPLPDDESQESCQLGLFARWALPGSKEQQVFFASGMGDGIYSGYWALDRQGRPVELIVPFLNPEFF